MTINRREFLSQSTSCAAHLALVSATMPAAIRSLWRLPVTARTVAREPFGNLEKIGDGVWALISTPLNGDSTTVSNGGIIAGRNAVLAIEGFNRPAGATWLANKAKELTGRWPTHVALTHYHADHANGVAGYVADGQHPSIRSTGKTRDLVLARNQPADPARASALADIVMISATEPSTLDLGGRTVRVTPRLGHTEGDISLELPEQNIVFCGDLFWNAMIPNFVDAIPTKLAAAVRSLRHPGETLYVPGHGPLGHMAEYDRYVAMLDEIEQAARKGIADGKTPAELGGSFTVSSHLGEWTAFNKSFYQRAFEAWYRELKPT